MSREIEALERELRRQGKTLEAWARGVLARKRSQWFKRADDLVGAWPRDCRVAVAQLSWGDVDDLRVFPRRDLEEALMEGDLERVESLLRSAFSCLDGFPSECVFLAIAEDFIWNGFNVLVSHPSFQLVPRDERAPDLQLAWRPRLWIDEQGAVRDSLSRPLDPPTNSQAYSSVDPPFGGGS